MLSVCLFCAFVYLSVYPVHAFFVLCAARVVTKESRLLVLPRTSYCKYGNEFSGSIDLSGSWLG
jgi:hypothetical protein